LHRVFKDGFLLENEGALLFVVGEVAGPAVAVPPRGPVVVQCSTAVGAAVAALFAAAGAIGCSRTRAEECCVVADMTEGERGKGEENNEEDNTF
jgi:hypothetical protein